MGKTNYWLKLDKDFFKSAKIQVLESQPNGKEYCLFYLKIMCESIQHNGELRFNDLIPYDENMLATITNTNIDVVRNACHILNSLGLVQVLNDGTLFVNEVNKLLKGKEKHIEKIELDTHKELEIEEKEMIKEKDTYTHPLEDIIAPEDKFTEQEIADYITLKGYNIKAKEFYNYYKAKGWKLGNTIINDIKPVIDNWGFKRMVENRNNDINKQQPTFRQRDYSREDLKGIFGSQSISDDEI